MPKGKFHFNKLNHRIPYGFFLLFENFILLIFTQENQNNFTSLHLKKREKLSYRFCVSRDSSNEIPHKIVETAITIRLSTLISDQATDSMYKGHLITEKLGHSVKM